MKSSNPVFGDSIYNKVAGKAVDQSHTMTAQGVAVKGLILIAITAAVAIATYLKASTGAFAGMTGIFYGAMFGALGLCFVISFKPQSSPFLAPIFALLEGVVVGLITWMYAFGAEYLIAKALLFTIATVAIMYVLYAARVIRATQKFKAVMITAVSAIGLTYLAAVIMGMFGMTTLSEFIFWDNSPISIGITAVVVVVAALCLILDFDMIDNLVAHNSPKYMEWYSGFALLVTIVWLYIEILRLLSKLQRD